MLYSYNNYCRFNRGLFEFDGFVFRVIIITYLYDCRLNVNIIIINKLIQKLVYKNNNYWRPSICIRGIRFKTFKMLARGAYLRMRCPKCIKFK